jgi:hypothetical protein
MHPLPPSLTDILPRLSATATPSLPWDLLAAVLLWALLTGLAARWLLSRERHHETTAPTPGVRSPRFGPGTPDIPRPRAHRSTDATPAGPPRSASWGCSG